MHDSMQQLQNHFRTSVLILQLSDYMFRCARTPYSPPPPYPRFATMLYIPPHHTRIQMMNQRLEMRVKRTSGGGASVARSTLEQWPLRGGLARGGRLID